MCNTVCVDVCIDITFLLISIYVYINLFNVMSSNIYVKLRSLRYIVTGWIFTI